MTSSMDTTKRRRMETMSATTTASTMGWMFLPLCWLVSATLASAQLVDSSSLFHKKSTSSSSPFKIILDGGSTGSRLHVFEFVEKDDEKDDQNNENSVVQVECVRRGSSRANIPLSAFGRLPSESHLPLNATYVAEHLLPLFEYAAEVIPVEYHATTRVLYQATAGMRLLSLEEQEAVYDALYGGLMTSPRFVFKSLQRQDIATLSGELEGFYGAVAANYLQGIVDAQLRFRSNDNSVNNTETSQQLQNKDQHHDPLGALDMGGSSTQIVFLPGQQNSPSNNPTSSNSMDNPQECPSNYEQTCSASSSQQQQSQQDLVGDQFFSTSYLSYGVDQFRERLWSTLVAERKDQVEQDNTAHGEDESCVNRFIPNPCANKGYQVEWQGFVLFGTGNTQECISQTKRLIPHPELPLDDHEDHHGRVVGGVEHPPVRGKFLAMSLYYFSLDSLRVFSEPNKEAHEALNLSWPTPSIQELYNALDGLCSRQWQDDMAMQHDKHTFTRKEVLPHRCIETVYMVTLLKYGYGFDWDSRDITFTFLVDGSEVEWTLGMALSMYAEEATVTTTTALLDRAASTPLASETTTGQQQHHRSSLPDSINTTFQEEESVQEDSAPLSFESSTSKTTSPLFFADFIRKISKDFYTSTFQPDYPYQVLF